MVRNAAQQARLRTLSRRILSEHHFEPLFESISSAVQSLTGADQAAVVLVEHDNHGEANWRIYPRIGSDPAPWARHFATENLSRHIIESGTPVQVPDAAADPRVAPEVVASGVTAFVGAPIPARDTNVGVLYAYSHGPQRIDPWGTLAMLQTLAGQAGLALSNIQMLQAQETRARQFRQLYDLGNALTESLELDQVLDHVADAALQLTGAERCTALVRTGDSPPYGYIQRGASVTWDALPPVIVEPRPDGFISTFFGAGNSSLPLVSERPGQGGIRPEAWAAGVRSQAGVPIVYLNQVVGAIFVHANCRGFFTSDRLEQLGYLAIQASSPIHNALLYQEVRDHRNLLSAMDEHLRHVHGQKQPEKLQEEIVRLAVEILDGDFGGLCRVRQSTNDLELIANWHCNVSANPLYIPFGDGAIGQAAAAGEPRLEREYVAGTDEVLNREDVGTLITAPLRQESVAQAVLFVGRRTSRENFSTHDLDILSRFAERSAVAWRTSQLMRVDQRRTRQLEILHQIGDYLQKDEDLYRIYHVALTGITAGFGLGFDRAALLLLDEDHQVLEGKMGIGDLEYEQAKRSWQADRSHHTDNFRSYVSALENNDLAKSMLEQRITVLRLRVDDLDSDVFEQVLAFGQSSVLVSGSQLSRLPAQFIEAFAPHAPLAIVALRAREEVIGLLVVDNKFTRASITEEDIDSLETYANSISVAVDSTVLMQRTVRAEQELRSLFRASNTLLTNLNADDILERVAEQARLAAGASNVSAVLFDAAGEPRELITVGELKGAKVHEVARPAGLSRQVMRTGAIAKFEDAELEQNELDLNPTLIGRGILAGLCLPMMLEGRPIGVIWYHFEHPRTFVDQDVQTFGLYTNQAVLAWKIAQRMTRLERLRAATQSAARVAAMGYDSELTLNAVVNEMRFVFGCDSVILYTYDAKTDTLGFPPAMAGVKNEEAVLRGGRVKPASPVHAVMWQNDVYWADDAQNDPVLSTGTFVRREGIVSAVGVPLLVGQQRVGVMFVNFRRPHAFDDDERDDIRLFADLAATIIHNAQIYVDFRQLQGNVGSHTAWAWMRMVRLTWSHTIRREVGTLRLQMKLLNDQISRLDGAADAVDRLRKIEKAITVIRDTAIIEEPSDQETVADVGLNDHVRAYVHDKRQSSLYADIEIDSSLAPELDGVTMRIHPVWLRQAFDIVFENSVRAMKTANGRAANDRACRFTIGTYMRGRTIGVSFRDTGPGIPNDEIPKLFRQNIAKARGHPGAGVGLLIAQAIVNTYGGETSLRDTGPGGTEILFEFSDVAQYEDKRL